MKVYKITFNLNHGGKRHLLIRANDCFQAFLYSIEYSKKIKMDIQDFQTKEIKGMLKLSRVEIKFLDIRLKDLKAASNTMPAFKHPRWLVKDGMVKGGYHIKNNVRVWIKNTGDWLSLRMDTGEINVSNDQSRLIAQFDEWGCFGG